MLDTARSLAHLHAAYVLTWCIQLAYVLYLVGGYVRVRREREELKK